MIWRCGSHAFDTRMPILMGILNLTPDSFSDGASFATKEQAISHALAMVEAGALIIDVGGESTRPGAAPVPVSEELDRVLGVVRELASRSICVSVDTRHVEVARACLDAGASIVNDISGFRDPAMRALAAESSAGLVLVHMQGDPLTMQDHPRYKDVVGEVGQFLWEKSAELESAGVAHERICIDPGPGFGKTPSQTVELLRNLHELRHLGYPIMAAVSRKSFLAHLYGIENPQDRDLVSATEALLACELGASVVRTHNVAATREALKNLRPYALIALGANVALVADEGQEQEGIVAQLTKAIGDLCLLPDSLVVDVAPFYASEPAYRTDQDPFVNGMVLLRTGLPPQELLGYLQAIERSLGRVRTGENGPRTCDLDIIDYQAYVSDLEVLRLPHPKALERDFVVKPLLDILPHHILANGREVSEDGVRLGVAHRISPQGR